MDDVGADPREETSDSYKCFRVAGGADGAFDGDAMDPEAEGGEGFRISGVFEGRSDDIDLECIAVNPFEKQAEAFRRSPGAGADDLDDAAFHASNSS